MLLSDRDIKNELKVGNIILKPKPNLDIQLTSCSVDLRLGEEFRIFQHSSVPFIDVNKEIPDSLTKLVKADGKKGFVVAPGEFVLASTLEWIELADNIAARLEGRSSLGRLGILIHATASLIPPGWRGNLVLEIGNISRIPVILHPKMRICALSFEYLTSKSDVPYYKKKGAKYINQKGAVASRIDREPL